MIIVTSGSFAETVTITAANGNVQLEAAPGVDANIDAIVQGVAGGATRQLAPGITVDAPDNRHVIIRNIVSRNWAEGVRVIGRSHVLIDGCRIDNNTNWGIRVRDNAIVTINGTSVSATGFRVGAGTDFPGPATPPNVTGMPAPGVGIEYENHSSGLVCNTCVTRSFRAGIKNSTDGKRDVKLQDLCVFDNNPDTQGIKENRD